MKKIWRSIEEYFRKNVPELYDCLNGPANNPEIAQFERKMCLILPEDLKLSLKIHNGECPNEGWIFSDWSLLPIEDIIKIITRESSNKQINEIEADKYTLPVIWSNKWIPFAYDGSGGYLITDLSPSENGDVGQVIMTTHDGPNTKISNSYKLFMEKYYYALTNDAFEIDEDELEIKSGFSEWWNIDF